MRFGFDDRWALEQLCRCITLVDQRGVGEIAEQVAHMVALGRSQSHEAAQEVFGGIDEEGGAGDTAPVVGANLTGYGRDAGVGAHRKTQAKTVPGWQQTVLARDVAQVVGGHEVHRV